ncbi:MAG: hypothetical protein COA58_12845 [Bacteroidetes bacterium]|nr:MAG: hypothetical protein COA58_12845 [Bacteroidota bacterium]
MKNFENISEFENLLKDQLGSHSTPPPADVWSSVAASTTSQSVGIASQISSFLSSTTNLVKVALFASGIAAVSVVIYNENNTAPVDEVSISIIHEEIPENIDNNNPIILEEDSKLDNHTISKGEKEKHPTESQVALNPISSNDISAEEKNSSMDLDKPSIESTTFDEEQFKDGDADKLTDANQETLVLDISNLKPCKGEIIFFNSNQVADWTINGKKLASGKQKIQYLCTGSGKYTVTVGVGKIATSKNVFIQELNVNLLSKLNEDGSHTYWLDSKNIIANWYIDNKPFATNTNLFTSNIEEVGKHLIKANPVNHPCASSITHETLIEPIGSIEFYNVFTPNGDGKNDRYFVKIEKYNNFSIQIFTETGVLVYASQNPKEGWDGSTFNSGKACAVGEYHARINYTLKGENPAVKNIKFTLLKP